MAKQTKRDRYHEHSGMERALHGYKAGEDMDRRHEEMREAGMIREDRSAVANMPQEVMMKPYPKTGPYMAEPLDDTVRGADRQIDMDDRQARKALAPHKY